jgi:hypothetical protein
LVIIKDQAAMDQFGAVERRRRNIRIGLFFIIIATLPFYCVGIILLGTAPQQRPITTRTPAVTGSPRPDSTVTNTPFPSITPFGTLVNTLPPLQPTPTQFIPNPGFTFVVPTAIIPPTQPPTLFIPPTLTPAPTLTPFPSETPIPAATWTSLPIFTDTPFPTPVDPNNPPTENPGQVLLPPTETVIPPDDGGPRAGQP